jgi:ABC-type uncharacterized transport system permease subunit
MTDTSITPAVQIRGIIKRFPGVVANDNVNLEVRAGEIHALLGENGAGKSTLMNVLCGLYRPDAGEIYLLPLMIVAGVLGGALWGLVPALLKAYLKVNEIITTLMLNYIAILWLQYLYYGPWEDPKGFGFPGTAQFPEFTWLPRLTGRLHWGLIFALIAAAFLWLVLDRTRWGYEIRLIGENPSAARYAGVSITRKIVLVMLLSGGLAGLAGISHRLQQGLAVGYGFTAIIVAWLASFLGQRLGPGGTPLVGQVGPRFGKIPIPGLANLPLVGPSLFNQDVLVYIMYLFVPLAWYFLYKTRPGLHLRAISESPQTADAMGVNVFGLRYLYTIVGGMLAGLGGAQVNAVQFRLQAAGTTIPASFLNMLPYAFTVLVLVLITWWEAFRKRVGAPAALGLPYIREEWA